MKRQKTLIKNIAFYESVKELPYNHIVRLRAQRRINQNIHVLRKAGIELPKEVEKYFDMGLRNNQYNKKPKVVQK